ncbi:hypothetical protein Tco_0185247 [Tanacetum coccineum]
MICGPVTFDELMKRTRSFIQGKPPPRTAEKATQTTGHRNIPETIHDHQYNRNNSYTRQRAGGETTRMQIGSPGEGSSRNGKDKHRSGAKERPPKTRLNTIYHVVEPLTIEINAAGHDIHRNVTLMRSNYRHTIEHCFRKTAPEVKSQLNPATTSLTGFTEKR